MKNGPRDPLVHPAGDIRKTYNAAGREITVRTISPSDRQIEADFVRSLSSHSRYLRFHGVIDELSPEMLDRFTRVNYPDDLALIATVEEAGAEKEIGVVRYIRSPGSDVAEVAIVIGDEWQNMGLGAFMLKELRQAAIEGGIREFSMMVLSENRAMMRLALALGFATQPFQDDYLSRHLGKSLAGNPDKGDAGS